LGGLSSEATWRKRRSSDQTIDASSEVQPRPLQDSVCRLSFLYLWAADCQYCTSYQKRSSLTKEPVYPDAEKACLHLRRTGHLAVSNCFGPTSSFASSAQASIVSHIHSNADWVLSAQACIPLPSSTQDILTNQALGRNFDSKKTAMLLRSFVDWRVSVCKP